MTRVWCRTLSTQPERCLRANSTTQDFDVVCSAQRSGAGRWGSLAAKDTLRHPTVTIRSDASIRLSRESAIHGQFKQMSCRGKSINGRSTGRSYVERRVRSGCSHLNPRSRGLRHPASVVRTQLAAFGLATNQRPITCNIPDFLYKGSNVGSEELEYKGKVLVQNMDTSKLKRYQECTESLIVPLSHNVYHQFHQREAQQSGRPDRPRA